jgi:arylsulfatase A-like enzyme
MSMTNRTINGTNIVVLLLDAARVDHLSAYGYERPTTPFIDELAAGGTRYDGVYANSVFSLPSYASLFTGQYPTKHGAVDWNRSVPENTLVKRLNDCGYETSAVSTHLVTGEFGLADEFDQVNMVAMTPEDRLFEDDPVGDKMSEYGTAKGWSSEREKYVYFIRTLLRHPSPKSVANGGYAFYRKLRRHFGFWVDDGGSAVAEKSREVIQNSNEPFFLFANFVETHDPYRPPRSVRSKFLPDDVTLDEIREAVEYSSVRASMGFEEMDARRTEILKGLYDAELRYVDGLVQDIYESLEEKGVIDSTVFVVLSDHGDFFGEHGLWGHQGGVYDPVSRVPLVVRYPWETDAPANGPYELRGLVDHLTDVANGNWSPMASPGEALVEYYGIDTQLSFVPWDEYESVDPDRWGNYQCGYSDGQFRLVWDATGNAELYDSDDFDATTDVAEYHPETVSWMKERVRELVGDPVENHERYRSNDEGDREFDMDDDVKDRLRQLGYTE